MLSKTARNSIRKKLDFEIKLIKLKKKLWKICIEMKRIGEPIKLNQIQLNKKSYKIKKKLSCPHKNGSPIKAQTA